MDTTTSSVAGGTDDVFSFNTTYVSCIKVDGHPILPPIMTEKRREEMRRYKEQAILKEKALQERRINETFEISKTNEASAQNESSCTKDLTFSTNTSNTSPVDLPKLTENRSRSTSPTAGMPATSTPRIRRTYNVQQLEQITDDKTKKSSGAVLSPTESKDTSDVPESVLRERLISVPPLDFNKSMSSVPSADGSLALSYDGDEEKCPSESDDDPKSDENFASAASSTGTFIIRRSTVNNQEMERSAPVGTLIKTQVPENCATSSSSEEEQDNNIKVDPPQTVVRNPSAEDVGFKRKRPAKYFDLEDEEVTDNKSKCSTFSSIPNYVPEKHSDSHKSSLLADSSGTSSRFSPVPITNFSSIAKSLANEFTKKFCNTSECSSTGSTANQSVSITDKPKQSGGSYDVRLSKDIPSSAEEATKDGEDDDEVSNSSDKENIDTSASSKHVRKLSYTLATPSAALLEAVSKSRDKLFVQTLETVPSAPSSVGIQSAYQTPEKPNVAELESKKGGTSTSSNNNRRYFDETIDSSRQVTTASLTKEELHGLNSGQGKQEHLKRFLGEQENLSKAAPTTSSLNESPQSPPRAVLEMQQILKNMQKEHENQLRRLAEQHRVQELRIRQEFESEMEKLKDKFSSSLNTTDSSRGSSKPSPNSVLDSVNISARSLSQTHTSASVALPVSISEDTTVNTTNSERLIASEQSSVMSEQKNKYKDSSVFQFTGGSSVIGEIPSSCTSTFANSGGVVTELSGVGLSRLQSRMQLMSPKFFRTPADARSPLLKGLVFLDPLDKPAAPLRIPQKALDPHMKPKFNRVSAAVKGFLTRRILNTEKVQIIVQTIRDTVDLLFKLYEESPSSAGDMPSVKPQDTELHKRLIQQLTGACRSFHDVFFKLTTKERMAIIATDREKLKVKALRSISSPARPNISNATLKSIERRMSHHTRSSPKRDHRKPRTSKASYNPYHGSQSVKPKAIKVYDVSPKRRRISYWDERNTLTRSTPTLVGGLKQDQNGNNFKNSGKGQNSSRTVAKNYQVEGATAGLMGETFIVPSAMQTPRNALGSSNSGSVKSYIGSFSGRRDSSTPANSKSISARSTQSSVSVTSSSSGVNKSRASISRQPWK